MDRRRKERRSGAKQKMAIDPSVLDERTRNIQETLKRLEEKIDAANINHDGRVRALESGDDNTITGDHEKRIRLLESSDRKWAALVLAVSSIISLGLFAASYFSK